MSGCSWSEFRPARVCNADFAKELGRADPMQIIEVRDLGARSAVLELKRRGSPMEFVVFPWCTSRTLGSMSPCRRG
jgi:hypothetical protein